MLALLSAEACSNIGEFNAQGLSNIAWAYATLGAPGGGLYEAIDAEAAARLHEFSTQGLTNLAWAVATEVACAPYSCTLRSTEILSHIMSGLRDKPTHSLFTF